MLNEFEEAALDGLVFCGNCIFSERDSPHSRAKRLRCHYNAPIPSDQLIPFPIVRENDWCGQFKVDQLNL